MKYRETATRISIQNRVTGAMAPPVYVYGKYEDAKKFVEKTNTLIIRFPEKWFCW